MINASVLNPKQKIYFTAAFWLVVLALIVAFIIAPIISQIKNDGLELAQKKQGMESFYEDWQILTKTQKDYQAMQSELNALPALLPSNEALKFIVLIEKFAQATNNRQEVSIVNNNESIASAKTAPTAKEAAKLQISLRGSFPDLIKFVVYLENAPYYNNIKSLQAQRLTQKENAGANSGDVNTILNVSVYQ